jgi:predicted MFS family arabinose efflux permease
MIGGFNVLGSLFFGWAGGRCNKLLLVGGIYIVRSLVLLWYFVSAPTPESTLLFAGIMGFLWLGISPLVAGWIGEAYGVRWQAMLTGFAFMSHQFGSFVGAFGGGLIYDQFGSYTAAWQGGVAIGLVAGIAQVTFALSRPPKPPLVAAA